MKFYSSVASCLGLCLLPAGLSVSANPGLRGSHPPPPPQHRQLMLDGIGANGGHPLLLQATESGSLGRLDLNQITNVYNMNAASQGSLLVNLGGMGRETLAIKSTNFDQDGNVHVRFNQEIHGMVVEGASIVVHCEKDGTIAAINGEFVPVQEFDEDMLTVLMNEERTRLNGAQDLLEEALTESGLRVQGGKWSDDKPLLSVVRRPLDGSVCLAWKRLYSYSTVEENGSQQTITPHADMVFADATMVGGGGGIFPGIFAAGEDHTLEGEKPHRVLCASHPKIMGSGIPIMMTYDCQQSFGTNCALVSSSSGPIDGSDSNDLDVRMAHNNAYKVYQYFWEEFGRDSMDDAGMPLISRVHYGVDYNNAFWDGTRMTYGDGDGEVFLPLGRALDVVAHELTHGVTSSTSNLVYKGQSGALNEAMSDIFAALVDERDGASDSEIWHLGESVYTPGVQGDALRSMMDPAEFNDYDYFPTRYRGDSDSGGVHWNSGIANLAFHLLVKGGRHPRGATTIDVPGIGFSDAAYIFYHANVNCLTPDSTFYMARICTAEIFGGSNKRAVHLAWDAVGVPRVPPIVHWLTPGIALRGRQAASGEVLRYMLGPIQSGDRVRCTTASNHGDADLFVRFGLPADISPSSVNNECYGYRYGSFEDCTTGAAPEETLVHIGVHAWQVFRHLSIRCEVLEPLRPEVADSGSNDRDGGDSGSNDGDSSGSNDPDGGGGQ